MTTQNSATTANEAPADTGAAPAPAETQTTDTTADAAALTDKPADAPAGDAPKEGETEGDADEASLLGKAADDAKPEPVEAFTLTPPEGFEAIDTDALEAATPILKELGVTTNEQAQEVIGKMAPIVQGMVERAVAGHEKALADFRVETHAAWAKECLTDEALGGGSEDRLNEHLAHAARFRDSFGSPELTAFLNASGVGNHPELVKLFAKAGSELGEGSFHRSDKSAQPKLEPWQKAYDPAFQPKPPE